MMKRFLLICSIFVTVNCVARTMPVHCDSDTAKINSFIAELKEEGGSRGDRIARAAALLEGGTLDDYFRTDSTADLRINVDSFTPLMFVNTAVALARTSETPGTVNWRTFAREFENISCRRGENNGFPSIMYHASDWIGDNVSRGNLTELTENYAGVVAHTKSLDDMTRNRDRFAALSDSATFESVRMTEMGFRTHRIPALKKETIKKKELTDDLQNGDIIILVPNQDGYDIYDMGFIVKEDGIPHLLHLSPQSKVVTLEKESLERYLALMTKYFKGYRLLRIKD